MCVQSSVVVVLTVSSLFPTFRFPAPLDKRVGILPVSSVLGSPPHFGSFHVFPVITSLHCWWRFESSQQSSVKTVPFTSRATCVPPSPQQSYRPGPVLTIHPTSPWGAVSTCPLHADAAPTSGTPSARRTSEPWRREVVPLLSIPFLLSAVPSASHGPTVTQIW